MLFAEGCASFLASPITTPLSLHKPVLFGNELGRGPPAPKTPGGHAPSMGHTACHSRRPQATVRVWSRRVIGGHRIERHDRSRRLA